MTPSTAEFIRFVFSRQGQTDVIKEGFLPVPAKIAERGLNLVGLPISK
jgi:phosphate transport system substrate-binding protein